MAKNEDLLDLVSLEAVGPSPDHVTITCERLALAELERCAEHLEASDGDGYRLLEAVRCLHLAMVSAMTAALNGSAGVGALPEKQRAKAIDLLNAGEWDIPERVMSFAQLVAEVQKPGAMEWLHEGLKLTASQQAACTALNAARERIDHPKPSTYIEARAALRAICVEVAPIVQQLTRVVFHHYEDEDVTRVSAAVDRILA